MLSAIRPSSEKARTTRGVPSKQSQLFPLARRRPEEIAAQGNAGTGEAKFCGRCLEPAPNHPRGVTRSRHAGAEARIVKLAVPRRTHRGQHTVELIRIMHAQPFDEEI